VTSQPIADRSAAGDGRPHPLGATWDGEGTNFALFSEYATAVWLCLFDGQGRREVARIELRRRTGFVWHCYVAGVGPGQHYGYRVDGPYQPNQGHRFNQAKLLIDPYARSLAGQLDWTAPVSGYRPNEAGDDAVPDPRDDADGVPKGVVVDDAFDWDDDRRPATSWSDTVVYELHVKGMTIRHPGVPEPLRGTYTGLCQPVVIDHLRSLGVTAVELLPVQAFLDDDFLVERGLRNYWGYNTIGFFAPEGRYASRRGAGEEINEFKSMVKAFHRAGIEVLLDVVYNHTAESNYLGPTLSFRGIDSRVYYRLLPHQERFYEDLTGTGNTVNTSHPQVLQLIADSLRYWVEAMHVDGFRFDLAPVLGRDPVDFDPGAAFFDIVHQDPVLSGVKLIAEPWDLGHGGYQLGMFPTGWSEWNDRFRDAARGFWSGHRFGVSDLAHRLAGSTDIFDRGGRGREASINYVTAHDGFTLQDLVSYNVKHNEANGEENRDGADYNLSTNHGVEGPTEDPAIIDIRGRQKRNLLATLLLSRGVPMICAGDEIGRSQRGNNNAYCQDNEVGWIDWAFGQDDAELLAFVQLLARVRNRYPQLVRASHGRGGQTGSPGGNAVTWFHPAGREMTGEDWGNGELRAIGAKFDAMAGRDDAGGVGEPLLMLLNADERAVAFCLPSPTSMQEGTWNTIVDTAPSRDIQGKTWQSGGMVSIPERTLVLLGGAVVAAPVRSEVVGAHVD
jgi:glycogen operon protein